MSRHATGWTLARRVKDRVALNEPGKHHPIWDVNVLRGDDGLQPSPYGGMEDRAGFAALARDLSTAA